MVDKTLGLFCLYVIAIGVQCIQAVVSCWRDIGRVIRKGWWSSMPWEKAGICLSKPLLFSTRTTRSGFGISFEVDSLTQTVLNRINCNYGTSTRRAAGAISL